MKKLLILLLMFWILANPVHAQEITPPEAPDHVQDFLPEDRDSFGEGLWYVIRTSIAYIRPDLAESFLTCTAVFAAVMLLSLLRSCEGANQSIVQLCGVVAICLLLLKPANALISLGADTVRDMSQYSKLLLPAITASLAAQGAAASSAALYGATALFTSILSTAVSALLLPMVYIYIVLSAADRALGDDLIKKLKDLVKWLITWGLKLCLYSFGAFISITGVISGTTDQTALKATKLTISGMVPVIGGILSDASETILLSAGAVKNAVGIYGLFAILAIALGPFFRIGVQYLLLKLTAAACGVFSDKKISGIIEDFSGAMGLILAITGTLCLMLLIGVVCFLKGAG